MEFVTSGIFGSLLGGIFRLAPEAFKLFDRFNERKHELAMFRLQTDLEKMRGDQKLAEIGAQHQASIDTGILTALNSAVEQQTAMVKAAGKGWIASLSASVRPVLTYYLLSMYGLFKLAMFMLAPQDSWDAIVDIYNPEDMALLCGVINYWFLDRSLAKRGM